jgi:hypothetical protein
VLVLEIVGTVDEFVRAVRRIPGLEWLAEWDIDDLAADDDFYRLADRTRVLSGRLFLIMSNQDAMEQFLALWRQYGQNPNARFAQGLNRFKHVFNQLRTVRPWGPADRLVEGGARENWQDQLAAGPQTIRFEAELWFRSDDRARARARQRFEAAVLEANGRVRSEAVIPDIEYHGVLAEVPSQAVAAVLAGQVDVAWVTCNDVMVFSALGQSVIQVPEQEPLGVAPIRPQDGVAGNTTVALLDGLPLENHQLLAGRIVVDDPDGAAANYPARSRIHGTGMASLIIHGDLSDGGAPLGRPIYVRPVMEPLPGWVGRGERMPDSELPVDLIHRAVRRLFEQDAGGPVAPTTRIVNLSLGDPTRVFDRALSPWARLVDWLAYRYQILIIVSAGNHIRDLLCPEASSDLLRRPPAELETSILGAIEQDSRLRRLLSPAESINSLTVGAAHADGAAIPVGGLLIDPYTTIDMPSPINALGLGYRRSVKPDLLFRGGRQLLLRPPPGIGPPTLLQFAVSGYQPPGAMVASPGNTAGDLAAIGYMRGTSVAAALACRSGSEILDELDRLRAFAGGARVDGLDPRLDAVLVKALLVHSASWGSAFDSLRNALSTPATTGNFREHAARYLGYGVAAPARVMTCTEQRATMVRADRLEAERSHVYDIPLPPSLSGRADWRRLTVTLAWLSPINAGTRAYRRAALAFTRIDNPDPLRVDRSEVDGRAVDRGTVQHEIFEGEHASAYIDGDRLRIRVDCRQDSGGLDESAPYALAVTLEVREELQLPIYEEIRARVRPAVVIRPG